MLTHEMAQRIEHWPLDKLQPYEKNPRKHSDAQVAQIAASIQAFGFNSPVLVDTNAGFSEDELRVLLAHEEASVDASEEVIPDAPADPVTRTGDCWAIGDHRLLCGDCRATGGSRHRLSAREI